jgi:CRP/FNR family transcriptional regulator
MTDHDTIGLLKRHPLFRDTEREGLSRISRHLRPAEVKKGKILYFQGDPPDSLFLIRSGLVKLSRITPEGRELTFSIHRDGEIFGEAAVLNGSPHQSAAETIADSSLFQIYRNSFLQILRDHPSVAVRISSMMGRRMIKLEERFQIAVSRDISSRIAGALLDLGERFGESTDDGVSIRLPLTHLEIASLIGSTRETTCVTLNKFRRRGWVRTGRRRIVLLDLDALRALCET